MVWKTFSKLLSYWILILFLQSTSFGHTNTSYPLPPFQGCKVTCHQKCYKKADAKCSHDGPKPVVVATGTPPTRNRVFSVPLENLVKPGEKIPGVIDRLITSIELYGLYTEGLYRKSGAATKVGSATVMLHFELDLTLCLGLVKCVDSFVAIREKKN